MFMRRPVISAPRFAVEFLESMATTRGVAFDIEIAHPESDWVGAGEPILDVSGRGRFKPGYRGHARCGRSTAGRSAPPIAWSSPTPMHTPSSSGRSAPGGSRSRSSARRSASSGPGGARPARPALFVGKLIPLHGLETILAAARLAPDLRFRVVGSGQLDRLLDERPPNVEHVQWVEHEQLPGDCTAPRARSGSSARREGARVIPNKVFQALACGTPVVTADTPAARELLRDGESALLVPPGDRRRSSTRSAG